MKLEFYQIKLKCAFNFIPCTQIKQTRRCLAINLTFKFQLLKKLSVESL